jgi:hypothetical protein
MHMSPPAQLLVYRFGPDSPFEGQLLGALERLESGGALRVLDALFVLRDPASGELFAIDARGKGVGSVVAPLLDFRLDPAARRRATERTRSLYGGGAAGLLPQLAETLEPGAALAAVLLEHVWSRALEDAVTRTGGARIANGFVDAIAIPQVAAEVLAAAVPA